jgi:hypothetical protein
MITPEETEAGLAAYEQVQAFGALRRRNMGTIYAIFPIVLLVAGAAIAAAGWPGFGALTAASAIGFALFAWWNWKRLHELDVRNRRLLAQFKVKYGEELPWLQVERQLAEIRRIQAEQAQAAPPPDGA